MRRHLTFWFHRDGDEETDPLMKLAGQPKSGLENLMNQKLGDEIYKAIEKLRLQQRSAFSLRYLEGLSLEEIAAAWIQNLPK